MSEAMTNIPHTIPCEDCGGIVIANRALSLAEKQQWMANDGLRELATDALEAARRLENALETARGIAYDVRATREAVGFES